MTSEEKKIEFAVFCIENVAARLQAEPEIIYLRLQKHELIENYIILHYDTLHTQSKQYIVDEVIATLNRREEKGRNQC
ncbi:MAG: DUF3791 domain-containing protein [Bacteroidales bacterium]